MDVSSPIKHVRQKNVCEMTEEAIKIAENKKNQSTAILMQNNSTYSEQTQDYWLNFRSNIKETIKTGSLLQDREMIVVSIEDIKDA